VKRRAPSVDLLRIDETTAKGKFFIFKTARRHARPQFCSGTSSSTTNASSAYRVWLVKVYVVCNEMQHERYTTELRSRRWRLDDQETTMRVRPDGHAK
jgi:hypothetical protein